MTKLGTLYKPQQWTAFMNIGSSECAHAFRDHAWQKSLRYDTMRAYRVIQVTMGPLHRQRHLDVLRSELLLQLLIDGKAHDSCIQLLERRGDSHVS